MKRRILMMLLTAAAVLIFGSSGVLAQAPNTFAYQGRLTSSSGTPITSATSVVFSIYAAASGGSALWTETISITPDAQGIFTKELGLSTPIPVSIFNGSKRYLGIKAGTDAEMTPRQVLTSGPYSISNANVPGIAQAKSAGSAVTVANSGITNITSRQITTPGPGYVVAYGYGYASIGSSSGTTMGNVIVGVDTLSTSYGPDYAVFGTGSMTVSANLYWWGNIANTRVFYFNSAVTKTFYMNAGRGYADGIAYIYLPKIQLVFYPTSYGSVTATVSAEESSQFNNATNISIGDDNSGVLQTIEGAKNVDLRELELRAAAAQAEAEKAQRDLDEARARQSNGE
ncbi:exported hypothetical protein [Candidatus Zixiibacteriota bacterium]|nr:exported hypothetical protein [candidate division Zixibacteria bacterium]